MPKLLMFSGGVESTALLHLLDPKEDYIGIIDLHTEVDIIPDHDLTKQHKILGHFGFKNVCVCNMNLSPVKNMGGGDTSSQYQPFAELLVAKLPVDELWWGCHRDDHHDEAKWSRYREAFKLMHPHCAVRQPFEDKTKEEQWNLIDDEIKPFVVSCYIHHPEIQDGCFLCKDRKLIYGRLD